uniref:PX domain-containing protein n=1 Tax=Salix viminalis TaxID=40686 RepID=A0A6N2MV34_SALVM
MEMMLAYPVVVNLTVVPSVENQCGKDTAISPVYIYRYFRRGGRDRWLSLGGIMLSITGTKALFADQSHFPVPSIQIASTTVVFPCLLFAYSGQAAYLIKNTCHVVDAFYSSIPDTSSSMWMNLPISILFVSGLRILCNEVEFSWKVRQSVRRPSYLSHLEKKQLSLNDSRLSSTPPPPKWKRKIDSPVVEAAVSDFIDQILKDFVLKSHREAFSAKTSELKTVYCCRDVVDLIGAHLDLFRRNQAAIGADVMATLSTEERDERLKHHLIASKELHPALISPESEYKVLQQLVGGVLAIVLRPREAQCPVVWTIAREITNLSKKKRKEGVGKVALLVLGKLIAVYLLGTFWNEIDNILLDKFLEFFSVNMHLTIWNLIVMLYVTRSVNNVDFTSRKDPSLNNQRTGKTLAKIDDHIETYLNYNSHQQEPMQPHPAEWARILEVATQRRTEVLAPENLENMWAKGRNYKKKENRNVKAGAQKSMAKSSVTNTAMNLRKDMPIHSNMMSTKMEEKALVHLTLGLSLDTLTSHENRDGSQFTQHGGIKRSNSTSALKALPDKKKHLQEIVGDPLSQSFTAQNLTGVQIMLLRSLLNSSDRFREQNLVVKRRYRNFERLHKHLKEIPNYTLHLPPKRIFSSSTEMLLFINADLLSIANVAEQHEVWDFLSASSKAWILWEFHENPGRYVGVFFLVASS